MKTIIVTACMLLLTGFSCESWHVDEDAPACIKRMARSLANEPVRNPPASIYEWTISSGQKYYYVPPYCCDMFGLLYDAGCNLVCAPDGGLSGMGDGTCPEEIVDDIVSTRVVWKDDRGDKR